MPDSSRTRRSNHTLRSRKQEVIKQKRQSIKYKSKKTIQRINKTKLALWKKKLNKIWNPLSKLMKRQRESIQINKKGRYNNRHQWNHKDILYLYPKKLGNLKEIDNFFDIYYLPKLNCNQIQNLNRPMISSENRRSH